MTSPTLRRARARARVVRYPLGLLAGVVLSVACSSADAPAPRSAERIATTSSALTIGGLYGTGVDDTGALLADGVGDPHYALTTSPDPSYPTPTAYVINANYYGNNQATSKWISADATEGYGAVGLDSGNYTYRLSFTLAAGVDPTTASITGRWSCDDTCKVLLNGTQVAQQTAGSAWTVVAGFTIPIGSPFQLGTNTLDFVVINGTPDRNPSGLLVDGLQGTVGCGSDAVCATGSWCNNVTANPPACQAKTPNGTLIPGGACSAALAARACVSGMCGTTNAFCIQCTAADVSACTPAKPACDVSTFSCAPCNADGIAGGLTPPAGNVVIPCPAATPYCNVTNGTCSTSCQSDASCGADKWCNNVSATPSQCQPRVANGAPMPGGTCAPVLASRACATGACDTNGQVCGIKLGDGTCTRSVQCIDGTCISAGVQAGTCQACTQDADCAPATPVCDLAKNRCVACSATNTSACVGTTPVCDVATETCGPCTGDFGSAASAPCPSASAPACSVSTGACGAVSLDAGSPPVDAGPPPVDAGPPIVDSGTLDASPIVDSGTPEPAASDASSSADASVEAAAPGDVSHPSPVLKPVHDTGSLEGSGIACAMSRATHRGGAGLFVVGCAPLLMLRRRRRRRR